MSVVNSNDAITRRSEIRQRGSRVRELCRSSAGAANYGRVIQGHHWVANSLTDRLVAGTWPENGCSGGAAMDYGGACTAKLATLPRCKMEPNNVCLNYKGAP